MSSQIYIGQMKILQLILQLLWVSQYFYHLETCGEVCRELFILFAQVLDGIPSLFQL